MNKLSLILPLTAALITACGSGSPAALPGHTQPVSINGTVQGYHEQGGPYTVEVLAVSGAEKSSTNPVLASTTHNAIGGFSLPLPSAATLAPYLSPARSPADTVYTQAGCDGQITETAPDAQAFTISTLTIYGGIHSNSLIDTHSAADAYTIDGGEWIYSTKDDTLSGSIHCIRQRYGYTDAVNLTANTRLKAGWNYVKVHAAGTYAPPGSAISSTIEVNVETVDDQPSLWVSATPITVIAQNEHPLARRVEAALHTVRFGNVHFD